MSSAENEDEDKRERPTIESQVVFKGDFNEDDEEREHPDIETQEALGADASTGEADTESG